MKTVALVILLVVVVKAAPEGYSVPGLGGNSGASPQGSQYDDSEPAVYNFQWDVNDSPSNNFYGQSEDRDGADTQGSYYVQLPDNRYLKVDYTVNDLGFHPVVTYGAGSQATAVDQGYSQPTPAPAQTYSRPSAPVLATGYSRPVSVSTPASSYS